MTKNFTNLDQFNPTPSMRVWIDKAIELMTENVSEIAEACKVSRQSWYQWQKDGDFIKWYYKEWSKRLKADLWKLDVIGIRKAKDEFRYWEAMQKKLGGYSQNNLEINLPEPLLINIRDYGSEGSEDDHK